MKRIPVTIITGFLGSGKTTLVNKIIEQNKDLQLGIVLNEFGDVKLESQFITKTEDEIIELKGGCVCCIARSSIIEALNKIFEANPKTNYVILEASGLSDPLSLSLTFYQPSLVDRFRLDSVVCVVDALNFEKTLDEYDIARDQIAFANFTLLSKVNGVETENIEQLKDLVKGLNPKGIVMEMNKDFKAIELLDQSLSDFDKMEEFKNEIEKGEEHEHEHEEVDSLFFTSKEPIDYFKFEEFLRNLPTDVVRSKGFINFANAPLKDKKYLLQYVVSRRDYQEMDWNEERSTAILFLGKGLNKNRILEQANVCIYSDDKVENLKNKFKNFLNS